MAAENLVAEDEALLAMQYVDLEQQFETNTLGMWIFLITEAMLFGGMFLGLTTYRILYPVTFTQASQHLDVILGGINTGVLIVSSLMMALAVHNAQLGNRRGLVLFLLLTILFGLIFLGIKGVEYFDHYLHHEVPGVNFTWSGPNAGPAELFFLFYFIMTSIHAIHLIIGIGLVAVTAILGARDRISPKYYTPVELTGLYWHFVDIIWVFLFPALYLIGGR